MRSILIFISILIFSVANGQRKAIFGKDPKDSGGGQKAITYGEPRLSSSNPAWKDRRWEYNLGLGASSFLGDLGGQDGPGQPFVMDFEPTMIRHATSAGIRYYLREYHSLRAMFHYAEVRGSDATTQYPNRRYRNLNFKSTIFELNTIYEFHILKPKTLELAGAQTTRIFDGNRFGAYAYGGVGLFYSNPKAEFQGEWYALKPLSTEGQGLPGGPEPYSRFNWCFPLGGGAYYLLNYNYMIGLDFGYRWTTTDYIDDASGYYYDNDAIVAANGKLAGVLADPSVLLDDVPNNLWYSENQPRGGNESNDTYMFLQLTLTHSFGPGITNRPIKQRKGGKAANARMAKKKKKKDRGRKSKSYRNKRIKQSKRKFKAPKLDFGKKRRGRSKIKTF